MEYFTELPPNFQEEMMNCELEYETEINEINIRRLIYIYTIGMQYYNIKEKDDFENYYRKKLNNLLLNENVIKFLDSNQIDLSKKVELNLFTENTQKTNDNPPTKIQNEEKTSSIPNKSSETIISNNSINNNKESSDDVEILRKPSIDIFKMKYKIKKSDIKEYISRKIKEVDIKLGNIDKQVSNNIVDQMSAFESNKRNKKVKKSNKSIEKEEKEKEKEKEENMNETDKDIKKTESGEVDLVMFPVKARRRGSSIGQTKLLKEIEEYVEENMKEMYKAIEELKLSYEGEIREALESGFDEIAESLKDDLKFEEENLKAQYEEERIKKIELIRGKHKKS